MRHLLVVLGPWLPLAVGSVAFWQSRRPSKRQPQKGTCHLQRLPDELVEKTLGLLDFKDIASVAATCRHLRAVSNRDAVWHSAFLRLLNGLAQVLELSRPRWFQRHQTWRERCRRLLLGATFRAQLFNRELDNSCEDFCLSAYDAVAKIAPRPGFSASTVSDSCYTIQAEYLPMSSTRVREQNLSLSRLRPIVPNCTPYQVYPTDFASLNVGQEVEVQWKGMRGHPYGWWLGSVKSVCPQSVQLIFSQYPASSPWHLIKVPIRYKGRQPVIVNGDPSYGYIGGIRQLSSEELQQWSLHKRELQVQGISLKDNQL